MNILVLETSSTSVKALIYHLDTTMPSASYLCSMKTETLLNLTQNPTELDPQSMLSQLLHLAKSVCSGYRIDLISIVSTWHSLVLCDLNRQPVSPIYLWSNQLAEHYCNQLKLDCSFTQSYYESTGCIVSSVYPFFKLLAMNNLPENLNPLFNLSDTLILDQGSFIMNYFTGQAVILNSMASGTGFYSLQQRDYDDALLNNIGIERNQLPQIVDSKQRFPLLQQVAAYLGLKEGIPVMAPGPDGAFNQLGADAMTEGIMTLSVGTSGALRVFSKKPHLSRTQSTWCYALEDGWLIGAATAGACNCVDYMKTYLFDKTVTYESLDSELSLLPIPNNTPIFLPFMFGERSPGWKNHRQHGLVYSENYPNDQEVDSKQKALLDYYATLEGVIFNLFQCYEVLRDVVGTPEIIKLSGGILHSTFWTQLCVDIFGVPMQLNEEKQASLMGGVFLARKAFTEKEPINSKEHPRSAICHETYNPALPLTTTEPLIINPSLEKRNFYQARYKQYAYLYSLG